MARHLSASGHTVDVLTAMPHYPEMRIVPEYRRRWFYRERIGGCDVIRSWIYVSAKRSVVSRLLNYFSFTATSILASLRLQWRYDVVFCESPPLFLGMSGYLISRTKQAKLILNVSDLWPDSVQMLGVVTSRSLLSLAGRLERFLYRRSHMVTCQTQGIVAQVMLRAPGQRVYWLPNGVDEELLDTDRDQEWRIRHGFRDEEFLILYAGIIGLAQGLDVVLDAAKLIEPGRRIRFLVLGDGPEKERLMARARDEGIDNVRFIARVPRSAVSRILSAMDATVIPLRKLDLFEGAIPSKIFESLAMGKPVLLGVDGEARRLFIDRGRGGLHFEPGNARALAKAAISLCDTPKLVAQLGANGRAFVREHFLRPDITKKWLRELR